MSRVELVHWNPRGWQRSGFASSPAGWFRRVNNFGDLLGPVIAKRLVADRLGPARAARNARLVSVGSILRMASDGDTVWGTGINGKSVGLPLPATRLDVRAVRGPRTRQYLVDQGFDAPEIYGDPGLLVGRLWQRSEFLEASSRRDVLVVPNLNDLPLFDSEDPRLLDPTSSLKSCLIQIASSDLVIGSSLHAIVLAESFGIPARLIASVHEPEFKYRDYFEGSGRRDVEIAGDAEDALRMGGGAALTWDAEPLLNAFPYDLWAVR